MKKKQYMSPSVEITQVQLEGMIAASLSIGNTPGNEQLGNGGDWNIWGEGEE
ncbi:MAG: hypothetical protein NC388_11015 [Clostridium sp.]|nr:hypothetical protein [Clostridium sp.]